MGIEWRRSIISAFLAAIVLAQSGAAQSLTRDADNPDLNGWQRTLFMASNESRFFTSSEFSEYLGVVPVGKRLVMDHVTGRYVFSNGDVGFCNFGVRTGTALNGNFYIPAPPATLQFGSQVQTFSVPMRFFADSGQVRLTCTHTLGSGKVMGVWLTVVGHLVDATPENDPFRQ